MQISEKSDENVGIRPGIPLVGCEHVDLVVDLWDVLFHVKVALGLLVVFEAREPLVRREVVLFPACEVLDGHAFDKPAVVVVGAVALEANLSQGPEVARCFHIKEIRLASAEGNVVVAELFATGLSASTVQLQQAAAA